jgi:hypothetical protein
VVAADAVPTGAAVVRQRFGSSLQRTDKDVVTTSTPPA